MGLTTLTSKSQITLPKDVRRALGLAPKDKFLVMVQGGVIVLIPLRQRPLTSYFGALSVQEPPPDWKEVRRQWHQHLAKRLVGEQT